MKLFEAFAQSLVAENVQQVFGLLGDGNMSLWRCLVEQRGVTLVSAAHEQAAVAMADGHARASGGVGVATVTHGPGLTQIGTSLAVAVRGRSALVVVVGQVRRGALHASQRMEQRDFVQACGAQFVDITGAENLAEELSGAFYVARVRRCPVVVNLDVGLQESSFDWPYAYRPSTDFLPARRVEPDAASIDALCALIEASERPVILAGRGAMSAQAGPALVALGAQMGALLATSLPAKGLFAGEAYDVGISGTFGSEPTEELLGEADLVLGFGASIGYYTSEGGLMFPTATVARVDIQPQPEQLGLIPGPSFCGDAQATARALTQALRQRGGAKTGYRSEATRAVLDRAPPAFDVPTDGLDPRRVAAALGAALPAHSSVTCGCGHFWAFPIMYMPLRPDVSIRFSSDFGAIGQTLPLAMGIAWAEPQRPQIVIEGDGAVLMNIQEMFTAVRFGMSLVLIVWNDGGYGAEVHKLRAQQADAGIAQWKPADFVAIARGFGGDGMRVTQIEQLQPALAAGLKQGGLFVIDLCVSPSVVSDPYAKLFFGRPNQAPLLRPVAG